MAMGAPVAGIGAVPGGFIGAGAGFAEASGAASYSLEMAGGVLEAMEQAGVPLDNPEALSQALQDPQRMQLARDFAQRKAVPVAIFDGASAVIGGRMFGGGKVASAMTRLGQGMAETFTQAAMGASGEASGFTSVPDAASWQLSKDAAYVHLCSNETIHGVEFQALPDLRALGCEAPLVVDFSSHVCSRPVDWSRVGLAFGGAQKNLGPAGLTLVVVREDLLGHALPVCPSAFDYQLVAQNQSMYNTPPTYGIYIAGLTFQWLKKQGGVAAMEERNIAKAQLLYDYIDGSQLYVNPVDKAVRSRMNVPFFLRGDDGQPLLEPTHPRNAAFLDGAKAAGLLQLKGHKSVGGMRASIYNAMPIEGVQALVAYMREFEQRA
jgi:phosphoserine aminotransferase